MRYGLFLVLFALATPVLASWAAVPLEILVDEADLIVVGKVARVEDGGFALFQRKYDVAVVEVSGVLKSLSGQPKEIRIAQPGGRLNRDDLTFRPGQQGIWLLTKDPQRPVYWVKHPSQFQGEKEQEKLAALIKARSKVSGGPPVNGLVAWAGLFEAHGNIQQLRFGLKNVTDQPILVCDYVGNQPLGVQWTGPDGKMLKSKHYDWLKQVPTVASQSDFVMIPPGGARFIGPRGKLTGILFLSSAEPATEVDNVALAGRHQVTISYTNHDDGKRFGLAKVWTGTVTAPAVSLQGR